MMLLLLFVLLPCTYGCMSSHGLRRVVNVTNGGGQGHFVDSALPVKLNMSEEEAINMIRKRKEELRRLLHDRRADLIGANYRGFFKNSNESDPETTTPVFDNPNFIPGDFLDPSGNVKLQPEPPVTDLLILFLERLDGRKNELWQVGAMILFSWVLQIIFIMLALWTLGVFIPLYTMVQAFSKDLPKEDEDKIEEMVTIAELYEENPLRFAHLPGFEIEGFVKKSMKTD